MGDQGAGRARRGRSGTGRTGPRRGRPTRPGVDSTGGDCDGVADGSGAGKAAGAEGGRRRREPEDPRQQARAVCLRLLAVRPRTRAELAAALRRRGVPEPDAEAVLERYGEVGMIDDEAFARAWVTSRHEGRGLARGALARELRTRGVHQDTISEALTEVDPASEEEAARSLVERRLRSMRGVDHDVALRRLVGMLARKGYPAGLSVRTVREALASLPGGAEFAEGVDVDSFTQGPENA